MGDLENLSFSEMLRYLKGETNESVALRKGWNGKNMFIFIRRPDNLEIDFIEKDKSLPDVVKKILIEKGQPVVFLPHICMYTADGKIVNGWLASQTDLLADDWQIKL